jgi:hypothetical protein
LPNFRPSSSGCAGPYAYVKDPAKEKFVMHQPSKKDMESIKYDLLRQQAVYQHRVDSLFAKKDRAQQGIDSFTEIEQRNLDQSSAAHLSRSAQLEASRNFETSFGFVAFSSGQGQLNLHGLCGFRMNWALVEIYADRFQRDQRLAVNEVSILLHYIPLL